MSMTSSLRLTQVERHYAQGETRLTILDKADMEIGAGEMVALVAPSGAGKSTLLHIAGLLEKPDGGDVLVNGTSCAGLDDAGRTDMRRSSIGFVYQFHHLLPEFSALENVMLPQMIRGLPRKVAADRAKMLLEYMRLGQRVSHRPAELSGGEQQRVAIARARRQQPLCAARRRAHGHLDPSTSTYVFEAMTALVRQSGVAALIATHNHDLAKRMDRAVTLKGGKIVDHVLG